MTNMQVRACRVRDLNPPNVATSTSTDAGHGAFCEHVCDRRLPVDDGFDLLRVSNGHSHPIGDAMNVYTLTVDLIGSTVTVTFTADTPDEAVQLTAAAYPEARSIDLEGAAPVVVSV